MSRINKFWSPLADLMEYFAENARTVTISEFTEYWKSLTVEEKHRHLQFARTI